jgi:hypothetical protein
MGITNEEVLSAYGLAYSAAWLLNESAVGTEVYQLNAEDPEEDVEGRWSPSTWSWKEDLEEPA